MKKIAISTGDINGVGLEIALLSHRHISKLCKPIYCVDEDILIEASNLLNIKIPKDFETISPKSKVKNLKIITKNSKKIDKNSGQYSYDSFIKAIKLAEDKKVDAILTLPIHKEAWSKANIKYKGHTHLLRDYFNQEAIMMLGCDKMYVALYTEHIPLKKVSKTIKAKPLSRFLVDFANSINKNINQIPVLGLNPHSGDNGVLGNEEKEITKAIKKANKILDHELFFGAVVPDIAFSPNFRKEYNYFVAMYHDQGLAPLKALYFEESINVSLNLPILRASVDHGTAFDISYDSSRKSKSKLSVLSYINAVKYLKMVI
jgi:4-hydroxythreonine-4-phosphate dehydrogenase